MTQQRLLASACTPAALTGPREAAIEKVRAPQAWRRLLRRRRLEGTLLLDAQGPRLRRVVDVLATGLGLLGLLPILACAALAIRITSKGPLFFGQERIGQSGKRFTMWKFRTMVVNADALKDELAKQHRDAVDGVRFKMVRDPRITSVGRLLRKFSIDELPQLFNVLKGDMTLIGPRPPVWREVALYDNRALRRLEVKPGLTCLWQVRGRSNLSFDQQVELDLEYIDRVRPLDEVKILLATIPAVVTGRGAY
jgi:lipopolysaccharide/colanic/teichoic acid biosynthesis glycosyltransferase